MNTRLLELMPWAYGPFPTLSKHACNHFPWTRLGLRALGFFPIHYVWKICEAQVGYLVESLTTMPIFSTKSQLFLKE